MAFTDANEVGINWFQHRKSQAFLKYISKLKQLSLYPTTIKEKKNPTTPDNCVILSLSISNFRVQFKRSETLNRYGDILD